MVVLPDIGLPENQHDVLIGLKLSFRYAHGQVSHQGEQTSARMTTKSEIPKNIVYTLCQFVYWNIHDLEMLYFLYVGDIWI